MSSPGLGITFVPASTETGLKAHRDGKEMGIEGSSAVCEEPGALARAILREPGAFRRYL